MGCPCSSCSQTGSVRLCGDYKLTINKAARPGIYPLLKIEELFAALSEGKAFTKLGLSQVYQHLLLDDASKKLMTINTL